MINCYITIDVKSAYQKKEMMIGRSFGNLPKNIAIEVMRFTPGGYGIMSQVNKHWKYVARRTRTLEVPDIVISKSILEFLEKKEFICFRQLNKHWRRNTNLTFDYVKTSPLAARLFAEKCLANTQITQIFARDCNLVLERILDPNYIDREYSRPSTYAVYCAQNQVKIRNYWDIGTIVGCDQDQIFFRDYSCEKILVYDNATGKKIKTIRCIKHRESNNIDRVFKLSHNRLISISTYFIDEYDLSGKKQAKTLHEHHNIWRIYNCAIVNETLFLHCKVNGSLEILSEVTEKARSYKFVQQNISVEAYSIGKHHWTVCKAYDQYFTLCKPFPMNCVDIQEIRSNKTNLFVFSKDAITCYSPDEHEPPLWTIPHQYDFNVVNTTVSNNGKFMLIPRGSNVHVCDLVAGRLHQLEHTQHKYNKLSFWNDHIIVGEFSRDEELVFTLWDTKSRSLIREGSFERCGRYIESLILPGNKGIILPRVSFVDCMPSCFKKYLPCCQDLTCFTKVQHTFTRLS